MTHYLINSPILTSYGHWEFSGPLSIQQALEWTSSDFVSAIGHLDSALFLKGILNIDIPVNRIQIDMQPSDEALVLRLLQRIPEGKVLDLQELMIIPFELGLLKRLK